MDWTSILTLASCFISLSAIGVIRLKRRNQPVRNDPYGTSFGDMPRTDDLKVLHHRGITR